MPEYKEKHSSKTVEQTEETVEAKDLVNEDLAEDIDDLLADIDDVLEENAEQFVKDYVQKGGQ